MDLAEVRKETSIKRIFLPSELWTDIFRLLSRRDLASHVQAVCKCFYYIAERNVPSVYRFRNFSHFMTRLSCPLEATYGLRTNMRTDLACHYRLGPLACTSLSKHWKADYQCRRHVLEMIQHCPQLFHGCHLKLPINIMMDYMYHLQHVRPSYISLKINYDYDADEIWKNQLIVRCSRLKLYACEWTEEDVEPNVNGICHWLHHFLPTDKFSEKMRFFYFGRYISSMVSAILENCKKLLLQATTVLERRAFVFIFYAFDSEAGAKMAPYRLINKSSGEILQLERHSRGSYIFFTLRRCLKTELINADQFYRETIEQIGILSNEPKKDGFELPIVDLNYY